MESQKVPNRTQKLYTQLCVESRLESFDDYATKETYEAVLKWLSIKEYSMVGTITFRFGGEHRDSLEGVARRLKRFLSKKIDGLRIVFVFEQHRLMGTERPRYHIHFLIEPVEIAPGHLKAVFNSVCRKIRGDGLRRVGIGKTDIREIYDQKDLVDYLTKPIRHGDCSLLEIDFMNSDLPKFQH